jgi:trimeric autotransporter adhesin
MELYGSLLNISGSVTASAFTGSFIGDGSGLTGIQASGVTGLNLSQISNGDATASISTSGFTVNKNTQIQGNLSVTGALIATEYIVSSSVTYMTTSFASGSSAFGNDNNDVHQFTGSVQITGSISLNGQAIGTGKLDETTFQSYTSSNNSRVSSLETSSGSLNSFTSSINTTIKSKLDSDNVISGSIQVVLTSTTGYDTFSSSISTSIADISSSIATTTSNLSSSIATTDLNQSNRLDSIEGKTGSYATTGSNLFKGTQTLSGSILPSVDNTYDLGSPDYQWRDVYISSGSLYIDGTKVLSSTTQELTITTDNGQSIKILESGTDSIILQTADGDIELKSNADGDILLDPTNGKILLKGPVEILSGQKIQSSVGGTPVVFANDIVVSGSIDITGTIEGINLTDFSSSVNTRIGNLESSGGNINSFTSSANSRLNSLESTSGSLNSYTSSNETRLSSIETTSGSLNSYTSSNNTRLSSIETTTSSILSINSTQNSRLDSLEITSGSVLTTNTSQSGRLDSIEGKTGSYTTTGSNIFKSSQTISGSVIITENLTVFGSSSITYVTSSQLRVEDNIITVNTASPGSRFGGLEVHDSGSVGIATGSLLWDSVNNRWVYQNSSEASYGGGVLLSGPRSSGSLGSELTLTSGRIAKSAGGDHLNDSNISDDGTTVTILSNAVVNGTLISTGTTLVSGSAQISHDSTTGYVANKHIDHTAVSISAGNGLSGGGDISATRTLTLDTTSATFTSGVKSKMSADGVVSGSSQISFTGITDKPTLVSGSSQITYGSLSGIPTGIVSGSSQITFGSISSIPGGLVSGSSQIDLTATTNYSTGIKTRLNAEGVLSGSAQVVAALPSGTVSGSAQVTLSSTTGFGTYINQAVLTSSSPTFAGLTSTSALSVGYSISSEPFVAAQFYNTNTTSGQQYGGILVSGINQAHVRFQVGTNSWGASGAKQWQIRVGNGSGADDMRVYSWTYGADVMTYNSNGTVSVASTLSSVGLTNTGAYSGSDGLFSHNIGNPSTTTELFVHNGANTPVPFRMTKAGYSGAGGSYGILQLYMNDNTNGNGSNLYFCANSSNGTFTEYGGIGMQIKSNTAGSATARLYFYRQERGVNGSFDSNGDLYTTGNIYTNGNGTTTGNLVLNSSNFTTYAYSTSAADSKFLVGTSNPGSVGNFTLSIGNNGTYSYVQSHSGQPLELNPVGNTVRIAGNVAIHAGNYTSYAMQGAGYSANQNLNTTSSPTFAGLSSNGTITITSGTPTGAASNNANSYLRIDSAANQYIELRTNASASGAMQGMLFTDNGVNGFIGFKEYTGGSNYGEAIHISVTDYSSSDAGNGIYLGASSNNANGVTTPWFSIRGGTSYFYGNVLPDTNNSRNLGSASVGWANVYTNDLHLSNMNKPEGNDVDGTNGNWTIQEGAENLYIINNNNGKKFKISLEEII